MFVLQTGSLSADKHISDRKIEFAHCRKFRPPFSELSALFTGLIPKSMECPLVEEPDNASNAIVTQSFQKCALYTKNFSSRKVLGQFYKINRSPDIISIVEMICCGRFFFCQNFRTIWPRSPGRPSWPFRWQPVTGVHFALVK